MFDLSYRQDAELSSQIWDYLYRATGQKSLDEISQHIKRDRQTIQQAVNHEWFDVVGDVVAIARSGSSRQQ